VARLISRSTLLIDELAAVIIAHKVGRPINVSIDVAMANPARGAMDATVE
jgi:hypothetical protein